LEVSGGKERRVVSVPCREPSLRGTAMGSLGIRGVDWLCGMGDPGNVAEHSL
ncbi:uncharacterized protein METZ01_LOCUS461588, partial [marine metagenome]